MPELTFRRRPSGLHESPSSLTTPVPGEVLLVGAGPGHPDWITLAGYRALRSAEVVVHDRLIDPELLSWIPEGAERLDVGKEGYGKSTTQEAIHELLVDRALAGHRVVRLKGGDPFVFGRGGEEALALEEAGIAWSVVPGLSSAWAAPGLASIPVTHRGVARSVAVVTAQTRDGRMDLAGFAAIDTLVFLMGVAKVDEIRSALLDSGRSPETNIAWIENAGRPEQRVLRSTLMELTRATHREGITSPATLVVGEVTQLLPTRSTVSAASRHLLERAS